MGGHIDNNEGKFHQANLPAQHAMILAQMLKG